MHDERNYINHTFYTELNKNLQIYGLILTSAVAIKTTNLIRPEDIRKPGKIETKDPKVTNFSILSTKPKRKVGFKRKMSYQLVVEFRIAGLQIII